MKNILVIDDEKNIGQSLKVIFEAEGYKTLLAETGEEGLKLIQTESPDLILLDIWLPDRDGLELLEELRTHGCETPVIVISGHGTIDTAVKAVKLGAYDFLEKPLERERTLLTVKNVFEKAELEKEHKTFQKERKEKYQLIGKSKIMQELQETIVRIAPTKSRVLITGESGVGKELVAWAIHEQSSRCKGPFVKVNCAAIPSELIESELFGHEPGAFTGAKERHTGKFEQATGGTIFLDEIADMSPSMQAKVLRVLQEEEIERVGGKGTIKVNVRVLAATNKDIEKEVSALKFREDLYFRLNVVPIHVPPLCERGDDIIILAEHFLKEYCYENNFKPKRLSEDAKKILKMASWPGNVRELKNLMERIAITSKTETITADDLHVNIQTPIPASRNLSSETKGIRERMREYEKMLIEDTLIKCSWNISLTARKLGLERTTLQKKIKLFRLEKRQSVSPPM